MRLYHHPFSTNARRAVITALELNTPLELVLVDLPKREQRQPAFLARNPAGRVPVLEDGSVILPESHAIMLYLVAQAANQKIGANAPGALRDQIVERDDVDSAFRFPRQRHAGLAQHVEPFLRREQRRLAGMHADRKHQPVGEMQCTPHHVEVAVGHRVERAGIKGGSQHVLRCTLPSGSPQGRFLR